MSYDTTHVRNAGADPAPITGIGVFIELVENPDLAALYTTIRASGTATGPDLVDTVSVSKKTVYAYLRNLEQAGLITGVDTAGSATVYAAEDFELQVTVQGVEVSITPALVAALARQAEFPVIGRVVDDHGLTTFGLAYDLVDAHADGDVTIRQIADLTGLSSGTTYDLVEALYAIRDLGADDPAAMRFTPEQRAESGGAASEDADSK